MIINFAKYDVIEFKKNFYHKIKFKIISIEYKYFRILGKDHAFL